MGERTPPRFLSSQRNFRNILLGIHLRESSAGAGHVANFSVYPDNEIKRGEKFGLVPVGRDSFPRV